MSEYIPLCVPEIRGNEWQYVKDCLDTAWVSSVGSYVTRFEEAIAAEVGTKYAVATVNGTAALHIALLLAGVEANDEVLVSTLSFIAPANAIRYCGAFPVFVDAEPDTWQMDPELVAEFLHQQCEWRDDALINKNSGRRVRAILPVHILGHPVDMDPLLALAEQYQLPLIEDATESLGATYKDRKVGSLGLMACFSFNGNKLITTGGGGMLVTDDEKLAKRAKHLTTQAKADPVAYIHDEIGYNYRLTNVQAAIGVAQMEQLPTYLARKHEIAAMYTQALQDVPGITCLPDASWARSADWMYTVLINEELFGINSRSLLQRLEALKIQTRPLWQPLHQSVVFDNSMVLNGGVAEDLSQKSLSLPCSVGLSYDNQAKIIQTLTQLYLH